jgi:trans-aconitate 2-methyltransferase
MTTPRDWDATTYDRVADPQTRWGAAVLDRLELSGDEAVLDAGCGSGRVTESLAERLPRGHVVAVDASLSMVEAARARLARFGDRVTFVVADLGLPFDVPGGPVDAILSTATFHWVPDHDALFRNLAAVVRPGGRLSAQFGGAGNIASVKAVLATVGDGWLGDAHYETPEATTARLVASGFVDVRAWLQPEPTRFEPGEPFETFLRTVILGQHVDRLPPEERDAFVHDVAGRLGQPIVDYVRLNVLATRG